MSGCCTGVKKDPRQDIEDLKMIIRSILVTNKRPVPLGSFLREFRAQEGADLPFRKFGHFSTPQEFLQTLPDTVRLMHQGGDVYVSAVLTGDIEHVQRLVKQQKASKPASSVFKMPAFQPAQKRKQDESPMITPERSFVFNNDPIQVSDDLKVVIRSLLVQHRMPVPLCIFLKDYKALEGSELPYRRYNHQTPESFLKTLTDTVQVIHQFGVTVVKPVITGQIKHIEDLVKKQKTTPNRRSSSSRGRRSTRRPTSIRESLVSSEVIKDRFTEVIKGYPEGLSAADLKIAYRKKYETEPDLQSGRLPTYPTINEILAKSSERIGITTTETGRKVEILNRPRAERAPVFQTSLGQFLPSVPPKKMDSNSSSDRAAAQPSTARAWFCPGVQQRMVGQAFQMFHVRENLIKVTKKYKDGLWLDELYTAYKDVSGEDLDLSKLGYRKIRSVIKDNQDIFRMYQPDLDSDNVLLVPRSGTTLVPGQYTKPSKNEADRVISVLQSYQEELTVDHVALIYQQAFRISISPEEVVTICRHMTSLVTIHHLGPAGDCLVKIKPHLSKDPSFFGVDPQNLLDITKMAYKIQDVHFNSSDEFHPVYLSHMVNPSLFYVQLVGKETCDPLERLMAELDTLYWGNFSKAYRVEQLVRGFACAALYPPGDNLNGQWHRAVVVQVLNKDAVEVLYVDYGTQAAVPTRDIRCLRSSYLELPAQAIMSRLAHIEPKDGMSWSQHATQRVLDITTDKVIRCCFLKKVLEVFDVLLCDVSCEEDTSVRDVLLQEGLARVPKFSHNDVPSRVDTLQLQRKEEVASVCSDTESSLEAFLETLDDEIADEDSSIGRYVQPIDLKSNNLVISIINYEGAPFVTLQDIAAMFNQTADHVTKMLESKNISIAARNVHKDNHPALFEQMTQYNTRGAKQEVVTLFQLSNVVDMLNLFQHANRPFVDEMKQVLANFDPDDSYWTMEDEEETIESLRQQFDRLKLKRVQMYSTWCTTTRDVANRLKTVRETETKIKVVSAKVKLKEQELASTYS